MKSSSLRSSVSKWKIVNSKGSSAPASTASRHARPVSRSSALTASICVSCCNVRFAFVSEFSHISDYAHRVNLETSIEETMRALAELKA